MSLPFRKQKKILSLIETTKNSIMKKIKVLFFCVCFMSGLTLNAQEPIAYWNFDDSTAKDTGNNRSSIKFDGDTLHGVKFGDGINCTTSAIFNGESSVIDIGYELDTLFTTNTYSISLWAKPQAYKDIKGYYGMLIQKWYTSEQSTNAFILGLDKFVSNNTTINFTPIPLNVWTHLTATVDNKVAKIYVNGNLVAEDNNFITNECSHTLRIGSLHNSHYTYKGAIDDVRIYDIALSESKINSIISENPLKSQYVTDIETIVGKEVVLGPQKNNDYKYKWNTGATANKITISSNYSTKKTYWLEVKISDGCKLIDTINVTWHSIKDSIVGYWNFNDSAALAGLATINKAIVDTGVKCSKSFYYNGDDSYISLGNILNDVFTKSDFTISLWAYLADTADVGHYFTILLSKWNTSYALDNSFYLSYNKFQFANNISDTKFILAPTPELNKWHHYVISKGTVETKMYIDNKYIGSCFYGPVNNNTNPLFVGAHNNNIYNLKGRIDELKIYNRAIIPEEVEQLYNQRVLQKLNKLADVTLSSGQEVTLDAGDEFDSYLWNDGSTNQMKTFENVKLSISDISVLAVNDEGCYSDTLAIIIPSGLTDETQSSLIKIWPNPVANEINIEFNKEVPQKIEIVSIQGKIISTQNNLNRNHKINVKDISSGTYFIKFYYVNNTVTQKFIKQ